MYSGALKRLIRTLYEQIPYDSKTAYESENMRPFRDTVDAITNSIFKNVFCEQEYAKFSKELAARDGEILSLCERNKIRDPEKYLYAEKFQRDLYRRMGSVIIKEVLKQRRDEILKARELRHAKARQKVYRESLINCVLNSMQIAARADEEAIECFEEFRAKLELAEIELHMEQAEM